MEKGTIIEQGTHDELLSQGNKYYSLWESQFPDDMLYPTNT